MLDKIIIVDIEATCWQGNHPKNQVSQIIEIGACLLDVKSYEISQKQAILVKPDVSEVSSFCTELTSLTQNLLDKEGVSLQTACDILIDEYNSDKRVWSSYGNYDRDMFDKDCSLHNVEYPFSNRHINIKTLFALKAKLTKEVGMAAALKHLKMPLEGKHHRGVDDAYNIAKIFRYCLQ